MSESNKFTNPVKKRRTVPLWTAIVCFALAAAGTAAVALTALHRNSQDTLEHTSIEALHNCGYYPVRQSMEACGFQADWEDNPFAYVKVVSGVNVPVYFDFETGLCDKKGYTFELEDKWITLEGEQYLHKSLLEAITNRTLSMDGEGNVTAHDVEYAPHDWTTVYAPLIAHAGGILRKANANQDYANGLNALVQNYDLGHRVFEIDFMFTADGELAAVHSGMVPQAGERIDMTKSEWLRYTELGDIHPIIVGDVLDQMLINEDMFLITDTKLDDVTPFEAICKEAVARNPALLDRVIPQIYNMEMYQGLMEIYPFPSIVFTTYKAEESAENIVAFCTDKDNIRVITVNVADTALMKACLDATRDTDILIYGFTVNAFNDITTQRRQGVWGLYTDYLLPRDFELYKSLQPAD